MRSALGLILASIVTAAAIAGVWLLKGSPRLELAPPSTVSAPLAERWAAAASAKPRGDDVEVTAAIPAKAPVAPQAAACANPDALGVSRVVEIDTTGGPGFAGGPWPGNTPAVLKALADECTKGLFFPIGKHATYHPEILKQVLAAGQTIGAHTWSHANLNSKKLTEQLVKDEIEKGNSAVKFALGAAPSPFFRFPELQHNPAAMAYLGTRNIAMFSCDLDSFDYKKGNNPAKV